MISVTTLKGFVIYSTLWLCAFVASEPFPQRLIAAELKAGALVLVNTQAPDYDDFSRCLEPYLIQFGISYEVRDVSRSASTADLRDYALIIIGHRGLDVPHRFLRPESEQQLLAAVEAGAGLVSFDGLLAAWSDRQPRPLYHYAEEIFGFGFRQPEAATTISIGASEARPKSVPVTHYITALGTVPRAVQLKRPMTVPGLVPGTRAMVLAYAGNQPLIMATPYGKGRAVVWGTYEWTRPEVKGKIYGLDDLVWRSLVWAARKPFVLRGMPHYLALRIDDVSGFGLGANRHLGYVATANRYGLKPWLGVFIDDLREDSEAIQTLARLTQQGLATSAVHARRWHSFFFLDEPLWNDERGVNIAGKDWPAEHIDANFAEAESFFAQHGILKSRCVLPHFYEFGTNGFEGLKRWGAEFASTVIPPGKGYGTPMLRAGPYLSGEPSRPSNAADPVFIADWLEVPGHPEFDHQFFNFIEEVRDVTGYEWAPSGVPVEEAIRRGVVQCRREFDSLLPAVLFTHESDHIQHLQPEEWERILRGVMEGLKPYQPVPVTLDFLAEYLRALHTSKVAAARFDSSTHEGTVELDGRADLPTKFYIFESTGPEPAGCEWEAPPFQGKTVVKWRVHDR